MVKRSRAEKLATNAKSDTVTPGILLREQDSGLLSVGDLADGPLIDHLNEEETPHYVFALGKKGSKIEVDSSGSHRTITPNGKYQIFFTITDERIFFAIGNKSRDRTKEISYEDVESVASVVDSTFSTFLIQTSDKSYSVNIPMVKCEKDDIKGVESYISEKAQVETILHLIPGWSTKSRKFKLVIPNRSTGKKVEKKNLDTVTSLTKDAVHIEEEYEGKIHELRINDEGVYLEAEDDDWTVQEIHRHYHQMKAIDSNKGRKVFGITFHMDEYMYRVEIPHTYAKKSEIEDSINIIKRKIKKANRPKQTGSEKPTEQEDEMEKLRKLSELKEDGIISEEEFEEKKNKILDRV